MADSKLKYIALLDILKNESSKDNPLTTTTICARLKEKGISKDRRNLPRDIDALSSLGYAVIKIKIGHENAFFLECSELDEKEVRVIIDALQAASFISIEETTNIISKVFSMAALSEGAEDIINTSYYYNTRKAKNDLAINNIDLVSKAIRHKKKIKFKVFDLDENAEKKYHKNGQSRIEEPIAFVFHKDHYYFLTNNQCESEKNGIFVSYRIDRVDSIEEIDEMISLEGINKRNMVSGFVENAVSMFSGQLTDIVLDISDGNVLKYIFEEFGEKNTKIIKINDSRYIASIKSDVTPTFYGWIFQFADSMNIISPDFVKKEYLDRINYVKNQLFMEESR